MYFNTYQFTHKEHTEEYNGDDNLYYSHYNFKTG